MSYTQVTPAWTAARVPVEKSSLCVIPGSRRCTCGSMNPGRSTSLVPSSILSSPPCTRFPTETILPSSDMPTWEYLSSPSMSILPSTTFSISSISVLRGDAGRRLRVYLSGERLDPRPGIPPRRRREAGLEAQVGEVLRHVPAPFGRDLRKEEAPPAHQLDDQAVPSDAYLRFQLLRGGVVQVAGHRQHRDLDGHVRELLRPEVREPRVVARGPGGLLYRLPQGEHGHRVSDASAQVVRGIFGYRDECAAALLERGIRWGGENIPSQDLGLDRGPGQGDGLPADAHLAPRCP